MKYIEIGKLQLHKDNPRKISRKELDKLAKSISDNPEYFEARPIITDKNFVIFAGNSRYKAAKILGLDKVPVHIMDLPDEKMREIMIRDNVNNGEWDVNILTEDWDFELLQDFGIDFKNSREEKSEEESKKQKKAKKVTTNMVICPHCNEEFEI